MSSTFREPALKRALVVKGRRERRVLRKAGREDDGGARTHSRAGRRAEAIGAISLLTIVALSALIVVMAADRPSLLSATSHTNFLPGWMAGPLGGLLPGLTRNSVTLRYLFSGSVATMYVAYLLGLAFVPSMRLPKRWAIAAVVAVHAILFLAPPLGLTDIFNYVNYGRMEVVHHLNPYTTIPILEPHGDPSYDLSNWHQLLSPYGPLFTLLTFAVVPLGVAASFWALKGIIALASLTTLLLVWKCARLLDRDPVAAILLVGLNPIVVIWGLGGDHNDFLMVLFIVLGLYLLLLSHARTRPREGVSSANGLGAIGADVNGAPPVRAWRWLLPLSPFDIGAGAAFVTATGIKASGGVLVPIVLAALLRAPRRLVQVVLGMVVAALIVGAVSLIAFGLHVPDLSTQGRLVTNVSVPNLLGLALGDGGETEALRHVLSGVLVLSIIACCVLAWRTRESITAAGWAGVALLVTLSWVLPWYVLWVLPLAALSSSRRLRTVTLVLGVYLIIAWAPASGLLWNAIGFHPEKTSLGRLHQRYVKELLN